MTRNQIRITLLSGFALVAALIASRPVAAQYAKQPYPNMAQCSSMRSGIKSWFNLSPGVASSPQCVTAGYEIHSQGVRIICMVIMDAILACLSQ